MHPDGTDRLPWAHPAESDPAAPDVPPLGGLSGLPVGVAFLDLDLRVLQANDAFARLSGLPAAAHAGMALAELLAGAGELGDRAVSAARAVIASGDPAFDLAATTRAPDGAVRTWRASLHPVRAASGRVHALCAVAEETTHLHDREAARERARAAADLAARRLSLVQRLTSALSAASTRAGVAAAVVQHVGAACGAAAVSLRTLEPGGLVRLAGDGLPVSDTRLGQVIPLDARLPGTAALASEHGVFVESPEALAARFPDAVELQVGEGYAACAALPLRAGGRTLGTLALVFRAPQAFDLEERAFLLGVARLCAEALQRARVLELERASLDDARRAADRLVAVQTITAALSRARTRADVEQVFVEGATYVCGADLAALYRLDEGEPRIALHASRELVESADAPAESIDPGSAHPVARVVRTGEPCWLEAPDEIAAAFPAFARASSTWGPGAVAVVPLRGHERTLGAAALSFRRALEPDGPARDLLGSIAELCAQALDRARLLERERALRAAAERDRTTLDGLLENAPVGIGLFDRDLRFVRVNPVLARMDGASAEAHAGRSPPEVVPGLAWEEIARGLRQVMETGTPRVDVPVRATGPDGRDRHFVEAWYPVRAGGDTIGLGVIVREVTAERDAQEFQRHVLGIVGHDLRTPLATIATAAHLLRTLEPLGDRQARLVERVASGAAHIQRLVGLLVDYAQAQGGRALPVHPRPCDLSAICRATAEQCEGARPGRTVRCAGEGDATGEWDPDRLGQALGNLVSNALDHGTPHAPVDVAWRGTGAAVEVEVANDGPPIPPELLPRLFEPFERGARDRAAGHAGGLGLGLFIARAIVLAHGGELSARSARGRTAFTLRLPRRGA